MARAKEYYLRGKCRWFKLIKPDVEYRCWSTQLYLDAESYDLFMKLKEGTDEVEGLLNEVKKDDDGYFVTLKRPMSKTFQGKETAFAPPVLLDADNLPWESNKGIGNGSDLTVKCEVYTFKPPFKKKRGSAIRLVSARVDNLVPFEIKKDFSDVENKAIAGLTEQPQQLF